MISLFARGAAWYPKGNIITTLSSTSTKNCWTTTLHKHILASVFGGSDCLHLVRRPTHVIQRRPSWNNCRALGRPPRRLSAVLGLSKTMHERRRRCIDRFIRRCFPPGPEGPQFCIVLILILPSWQFKERSSAPRPFATRGQRRIQVWEGYPPWIRPCSEQSSISRQSVNVACIN